jgi:hypothetical protein
MLGLDAASFSTSSGSSPAFDIHHSSLSSECESPMSMGEEAGSACRAAKVGSMLQAGVGEDLGRRAGVKGETHERTCVAKASNMEAVGHL